MAQKVIWILLADAGHARIIERLAPLGNTLVEIESLTHSHESNQENGPDRPGRNYESANIARHAYQPRTDWREQQKEAFAIELAERLHKANNGKKFDELYILAPSKMLGLLRHHIDLLDPQMTSKISRELPKDAVKLTLNELRDGILAHL